MHAVLMLVALIAQGATTERATMSSWRQRVAWYNRTMVEAYDKFGKHNEKWDKQAHAAIAELAHAWTSDGPERFKAGDQSMLASRAAIAAGCDDPMLIYVNAAGREQFGRPGKPELLKLYQDLKSYPIPARAAPNTPDNNVALPFKLRLNG